MLTTTPHGLLDLLSAVIRVVLVLTLVEAGCMYSGIRLNTTASLPIGLYIRSSDKARELVEFCPPKQTGAMALARGYRSSGACPDGGEPLLKPVVAKHGDVVTVSADGIAINSKLLPNSRPRKQDSFGRELRAWPCGAYSVADGTVWVVSTYSVKSFDSRYFGPISTKFVRAHLVPLLTE